MKFLFFWCTIVVIYLFVDIIQTKINHLINKDYIKIETLLQSFYLNFFSNCQNQINNFLQTISDHFFNISENLFIAAKYSLLEGGKRVRPALVYAIGDFFEIELSKLNTIAASVELIHCFSLIHDDLPAMDDDDLRRGKPSCHKAFNEATAILVGDGLQALAFQILADSNFNKFSYKTRCGMVLELAKATGFLGMVRGQSQDIDSEGKQRSLKDLELLHSYKTGALINVCIKLAILAANFYKKNNLAIQKQLLIYGEQLGLMFQIQDDILDVQQSTNILGKTSNSDQKFNKATFVSLLGLEEAKLKLEKHYNLAISALQKLPKNKINLLQQFANYFKEREF